jgi:hypothetical protein
VDVDPTWAKRRCACLSEKRALSIGASITGPDTSPTPSSTIERTIETGSSPWIFAWTVVSFTVVLSCVIYLSTVSF